MPRRAAATPPPTAYQRALLRLARRDHSVAELRRALLERGHEPAEIEEALERLRRERYLDDAGFAERFARSRMQHQGLGRLRIRQGLRQRGVDRGTTEAGIAGALREVDECLVLDGRRPPLLATARRGRARPAASPPLGVPAAAGLLARARAGPAVRPLAAMERRARGARAGRGRRRGAGMIGATSAGRAARETTW